MALTGCTCPIYPVLPEDNPNQGRIKINNTFDCIVSNLFPISGATGSTFTFVQNGTNTYTGGTPFLPTVNVSALTINTLTASGNTSLQGTTAHTLNITVLGTGTSINSLGIDAFGNVVSVASGCTYPQYLIPSGQTVIVCADYQYLIYGDLTIFGTLINYGQVVILNGAMNLSGGTFDNFGTLLMQSLSLGPEKDYSAIFSASANTPVTITHNLGTIKLLYNAWDSSGNELELQLTKINPNTVQIVSTVNIVNGEIDIMGI